MKFRTLNQKLSALKKCLKISVRTDDGELIGRLHGCPEYNNGDLVLVSSEVHLKPEYERQKIGTQLYERAAKVACANGVPFQSSPAYARNKKSSGFWEKQMAKGRAFRINAGTSREAIRLKDSCSVTTLSGPPTKRSVPANQQLTPTMVKALRALQNDSRVRYQGFAVWDNNSSVQAGGVTISYNTLQALTQRGFLRAEPQTSHRSSGETSSGAFGRKWRKGYVTRTVYFHLIK